MIDRKEIAVGCLEIHLKESESFFPSQAKDQIGKSLPI
jgi:hypothetical protein